jgi:hypothetical protein
MPAPFMPRLFMPSLFMPHLFMPSLWIKLQPDDIAGIGDIARRHLPNLLADRLSHLADPDAHRPFPTPRPECALQRCCPAYSQRPAQLLFRLCVYIGETQGASGQW